MPLSLAPKDLPPSAACSNMAPSPLITLGFACNWRISHFWRVSVHARTGVSGRKGGRSAGAGAGLHGGERRHVLDGLPALPAGLPGGGRVPRPPGLAASSVPTSPPLVTNPRVPPRISVAEPRRRSDVCDGGGLPLLIVSTWASRTRVCRWVVWGGAVRVLCTSATSWALL